MMWCGAYTFRVSGYLRLGFIGFRVGRMGIGLSKRVSDCLWIICRAIASQNIGPLQCLLSLFAAAAQASKTHARLFAFLSHMFPHIFFRICCVMFGNSSGFGA